MVGLIAFFCCLGVMLPNKFPINPRRILYNQSSQKVNSKESSHARTCNLITPSCKAFSIWLGKRRADYSSMGIPSSRSEGMEDMQKKRLFLGTETQMISVCKTLRKHWQLPCRRRAVTSSEMSHQDTTTPRSSLPAQYRLLV